MSPSDIYNAFISRIDKTNILFEMLTYDSLFELSNKVLFKYYFDISTAIEAITRGITFSASKKHKYFARLAQPDSDKVAYFKEYEDIKALCGIDELYAGLNKSEFQTKFCNKVFAMKDYKISKSFINDGLFRDEYISVRKARNTLAHGLVATDTIEYSKSVLESFLYILYLLYSYYKRVFE